MNLSSTEGTLIAYLVFITAGLLLYALFPKKQKWTVLLVFSLGLIFFLSSYWFLFLLLGTLIVYLCGLWVGHFNKVFDIKKEGLDKQGKKKLKNEIKNKQRLVVVLGVVLSFIVLALLKYLHLPIGKLDKLFTDYSFTILFPILGISYYTLSSTGYLIDVGRKKYDPEKNYFKLLTFVGFFPLQIEGPICRFDKIKESLFKTTNPSYKNLSDGGVLIIWGIFKKIVIADRLNLAVHEIFAHYQEYNGAIIILGGILYAFQLYCDFSGFVDLGRGAAKMFGVETEENFDRPFLSTSVGEFWRRWHMSLGSWMRDYVFYTVNFSKPLMKINDKLQNAKPVIQNLVASAIPMFFVWLFCGVWHGSGVKFIVYGMYYYVIMMFGLLLDPVYEKLCTLMKLNRKGHLCKTLAIIRTFIFVLFGMMMFRADSLTMYFNMLGRLFKSGEWDLVGYGLLNEWDLAIMAISISFILIIEIIQEFIPLRKMFDKWPTAVRFTLLILLVVIIIIFGAWGSGYGVVDPMYAAY